jgi:hypothetical protein
MEVVVDGKTGLAVPDEGTTLRAVLESLKTTVASRRRIIIAFTLDGQNLTPERQGLYADQAPGKFSLLEVRTADPQEMSVGTLTGLIGHLQNMERGHADVITAVTGGEYGRSLDKSEALFFAWDILLRAVRDVGALLSPDYRSIDATGASIETRIRELQEVLLRFSSALEYKDVARVTEIVDQELKPKLPHWRGVLEALGRLVKRPTP